MIEKTQKLLIIGHVWPQPNASAAGEHMIHLIRLFTDLGFQIYFTSAAQQPEGYKDLDGFKIICASTEINSDVFDDYLNSIKPDVVLFDRFMVEEQFSWRVKKECPNALRILDTEDIHFLRKERQASLKGKHKNELSDTAKREVASIYRSDISLIISQEEINLLTESYNIPKSLLFYLPLLSEEVHIERTPNFEDRSDVIFVGNFLHEPNWQAVQVLKQKIWPLVRAKNKEINLHIYGAYASDKHKQLNNVKERFFVHGYVEDLEKVLRESKILIAPLFFGAGQKGKLLKAMQCGTPTVTTSIGAEAMQFEKEWPGLIEDNYEDLASALLKLYDDKELWENKQMNITDLVNEHFQYTYFLKTLKQEVPDWLLNLNKNRMSNITGEILWHHSMRSTEFMSRWIMEKNK